MEHNELEGSVLGGGAIYPSATTHHMYFGHNSNRNHWSGDREAMTYDGGGSGYYGPVESCSGHELVVPAGLDAGYAEVLAVLNGSGFGQVGGAVRPAQPSLLRAAKPTAPHGQDGLAARQDGRAGTH